MAYAVRKIAGNRGKTPFRDFASDRPYTGIRVGIPFRPLHSLVS